MLELFILLSQTLDLVAGGIPQAVSGQAVLAGLQKALGPFVVDTAGYAFSPAYLRYGYLAWQALKDDADLLICGERTPDGLSDLCDNVL